MHNILPEIKNRYSVSFFLNRDVEKEKIDALVEAARWAPSAFNNQPWNYILVAKTSKYRKALEDSLALGNGWAKKAPYLVVVYAREKDDKPYNNIKYHIYDTALSVMNFCVEAEHQGLKTHQMAGFKAKKVKSALGLKDEYDVLIIIALGYEAEKKPVLGRIIDKVKEKAVRQRERKPKKENFFIK